MKTTHVTLGLTLLIGLPMTLSTEGQESVRLWPEGKTSLLL